MAIFIMVHGAWHTGASFDRVREKLESLGHQVIAPTLPGMGGTDEHLSSVTLDGWGEYIADLARVQKAPVVLCGHSRGGIVISTAAEKAPEAVLALVYITAFLLPAGDTVVGFKGRVPGGRSYDHHVSLIAEGIGSSIDPVGAALAFYGDADEEDKRLALSSLASEPYWPARTPLELTDERFGSVRRFYVECTEDKAVWLDHQREMHTALPVEHVETLRSGHSPFLTQPDDLVDALLRILDRAEASPPSIERRG